MTAPTIVDVLAAPGVGAFFFDDQAAIKRGVERDGFALLGEPVTPGFEAVRQPAAAVSVMLTLTATSPTATACPCSTGAWRAAIRSCAAAS